MGKYDLMFVWEHMGWCPLFTQQLRNMWGRDMRIGLPLSLASPPLSISLSLTYKLTILQQPHDAIMSACAEKVSSILLNSSHEGFGLFWHPTEYLRCVLNVLWRKNCVHSKATSHVLYSLNAYFEAIAQIVAGDFIGKDFQFSASQFECLIQWLCPTLHTYLYAKNSMWLWNIFF